MIHYIQLFAWMKSRINCLENQENPFRWSQAAKRNLIVNMCEMELVVSSFSMSLWQDGGMPVYDCTEHLKIGQKRSKNLSTVVLRLKRLS